MDGNKIVFDIESGGFEKTKNALCELGALVINADNEIIDTFHFYVKPYGRDGGLGEQCSYKPDAMAVNGLSEEKLAAEGEIICLVLQKFAQLLEKYQIQAVIGHNSDFFDVKWISYLLQLYELDLAFNSIRKVDTMKLAQARMDCRPENYKLGTLCAYYGIEITDAHTAIGDCTATLELYRRLL